MIFDRRKKPQANKPELKPVDLPLDYLKIVEETLNESLKKGIAELKKFHPICNLKAGGVICSDEVLLAITISHGENSLIATTVYASADFNPLLPEPTVEIVLDECLASAGTVLSHYLDHTQPERIAQLAGATISALEEAPFEWTAMEETKVSVYVKIDKSNPALEALAEDWLLKNDPHYSKEEALEEAEEFLEERLQAIQKAKSGSSGDSGPIRH
jgi:hypothetical protein